MATLDQLVDQATIGTDFQRFPLPGTSTLFKYDVIVIKGQACALDGPIEAGIELDVEKRKSPGSDYSSYVSHGLDTTPIRIRLALFRDLTSGKDWFQPYFQVKDSLIPNQLSKRNSIEVYHPWLNLEGINQIVFTKRSLPVRSRGLIFTVTLEGYSTKTLRIGTKDGASKKVEQDKQLTSRATAKQAPANVKTPSQNNKGKALAPSQRSQ